MVANSSKNQALNTESSKKSGSERSYPGLNRLSSIQQTVQESLLNTNFFPLGNDGGEEFLPSGSRIPYSVYFQPADQPVDLMESFDSAAEVPSVDPVRMATFQDQEDLIEDLLEANYKREDLGLDLPILIFEPDFQKAAELSRKLGQLGKNTHLSSCFSNWANVMGRLGAGSIEILISTTLEIPLADQIAWNSLYLPSKKCLGPDCDPDGWIAKSLFADSYVDGFEIVVGSE